MSEQAAPDEDLTPKAVPTSDRHSSETAIHKPTDTHLTPEAAADSARVAADKAQEKPPGRGPA